MSEAQRTYRRELALYCLTREQQPVTAADLSISMQAAAQTEGHARALWQWLDGVQALAVLRSLHKAGQAQVSDHVRDSSAGRDVPRWATSAARTPMPAPPEHAAQQRELQRAVDALQGVSTAAQASVPAHESMTDALRALCAHQAAFIARFVECTSAEAANDE